MYKSEPVEDPLTVDKELKRPEKPTRATSPAGLKVKSLGINPSMGGSNGRRRNDRGKA